MLFRNKNLTIILRSDFWLGLAGYLLFGFVFSFLAFRASLISHLLNAAIIAGIVLLSLFFHELSHVLSYLKISNRLQTKPEPVELALTATGGQSEIPTTGIGAKQLSIVALMGPASNLFLTAFFAVIVQLLPTAAATLSVFLWFTVVVNAALLVFNLYPALPLDGGKALWWGLEKEQRNNTVQLRLFQKLSLLFRVSILIIAVVTVVLLPTNQSVTPLSFGFFLLVIAWLELQNSKALRFKKLASQLYK